MKKRLKRYAYKSPLLEVDKEQFILDYDSCGTDKKLRTSMDLFGKLVQKYFTITHTEVLPGMIIYHYV